MKRIGKIKKRTVSLILSILMMVTLSPYSAVASFAEGTTGGETEAPVFKSARNYGGAYTDSFKGVANTKDGGFVVMGYSMSDWAEFGWTHLGGRSNNDTVLMKFDRDRKLQWARSYSTEGVDVFFGLDVLTDGRIVTIGRQSFNSDGGEIKNVCWNLLVINPDDPDDYTDYHIGGDKGDQGYGIAATSDGGFVAGGWSASDAGFITSSSDRENYTKPVQLWESADGTDEMLPNKIADGKAESIIIKFDKNGQVVFTAIHDYCVSHNEYYSGYSSAKENLEDIAVDSKDDIYMAGVNSVSRYATNGVIAKLSGTDGHVVWERSAGRKDATTEPWDKSEYIKAVYSGIAVLNDDSVVVVGESGESGYSGDATTEEGWKVTSENDSLVVHYGADGSLLFADSFGTISDSGSRPEGVTATPDGGFIVNGSQAGVMQEDDRINQGYNWGNYGGNDGILVKYTADNKVLWADNYGTKLGDWINAVTILEDGNLVAVGESNGMNGVPAWDNNGGYDGVIMCTAMLDSYNEPVTSAADGQVKWQDGSYSDTGNGFGGVDSVGVTVEIADGKISSVVPVNYRDTEGIYNTAAAGIPDRIIAGQSADVDTVTGATYSSNGIMEAVSKSLSQAAAAYVDSLILKIEEQTSNSKMKTATTNAANAYAELGTYSVQRVSKFDILEAYAEAFEITLNSRAEQAEGITETLPTLAPEGLEYNDTYYKLQDPYYQNIQASAFETAGLTGEGVTIAVIDSGLTRAHKDLDYSLILPGYDYDNNTEIEGSTLLDNDGHGTAVTGILNAIKDNGIGIAGLLGDVRIVPLKVSPKAPAKDTDGASSKQVAQAIRDAVDKYQVDVITTSLDVKDTEELKEAVAYAASRNVIVTGASGNTSSSESDPYVYPASYDEVISVGAVDANNTVRTNSTKNDQVFVTAPGENVVLLAPSMSNRCKISSGTSYSSPVVAAMAVAAKQVKKDITVDEFKELLKATSTDAGSAGYDTSYGYGIVNFAAFSAALNDVSSSSYILMNIPYADFYAAEDGAVDSVTSATLNGKARNVNVNGASYHQSEETVSSEGIVGATYPVKVKLTDLAALKKKGIVEVTDDTLITYEMNARGQVSTVELTGAQALQESPTYSYYALSEEPASYKELTITDGVISFGKATGTPETGEATGEATIGARHADIEIPLSGVEVEPKDVSGVTITTDKGTYALHHVVNIWRGTELGWNLSDLDLGGQTITKIRYFLKDGSIKDYTANIPIASAGYVLMNIPYADFYKAELGEADAAVDAVTSSTLNKPRTGNLAGGSYHKNADGSDISGVIYPVFVKDVAQLEGLTEITDASSVTITVTNRGTTTETTYEGKDALFESADYSYYKLDTKPARYKTMTVEDGTKSFSAVNGRATIVADASGEVNEAGHHADVEIQLSNTTGIEQGQMVSGVVVTFDDGSKAGLRHISELWRATEIGGTAEQFAGKTITNVRYYTQDSVIDFPMEIKVKEDPGDVTAAFTSAKNVKLTGLPEDLENPVATVQTQVGRGETPTVIADAVAVTDGNIATDAAEDGKTYAITVSSDNYLPIKTTADYTAPKPSSGGGGGGGSVTPTYKVTAPAQTSNGSVSASLEKAKKGDTVTITVDPEEGYEPDTVTVKDKDGNTVEVKDNGDGTYSFTMPASAVSVEASFKEKEAEPQPPVPDTHDNCPSEPFKDVDTSLWYHEGIDYVIANGLMNGTAEDAFAPDETTTRAMIVTILYRLEKEPAAEASSFKDLEAGSWYEAAVNWAAANNIVNGYNAEEFGPSDTITREQMAAILCRYAVYKGQDISGKADLSGFTDSSAVSDWATDAVAWAVNAELVNGMTETTLVPQGSATRAQVATLMMRLCENVLR